MGVNVSSSSAGLGAVQILIFRVIHLEARLAATHLTKTAQLGAGLKALLLGSIKVKKPQCDNAAMILDATHQTAATPKHNIAGPYLSLNHNLGHGLNTADGGNLGAVYIAQGQVKQ